MPVYVLGRNFGIREIRNVCIRKMSVLERYACIRKKMTALEGDVCITVKYVYERERSELEMSVLERDVCIREISMLERCLH